MNILETGQESGQKDNRELNRMLSAYFKFCGERSGNEGWPNEGFRRFESPYSVWQPIRWGNRSKIIEAVWFLTNPEASEYGICGSWAEGNPENIFGYKDENGKQVVLGERSYITFYTSTDGSRARFTDNYEFFTNGKIIDKPKLRLIQTNLTIPQYYSAIMNFPTPESPDRKSWLERSFPKEDQWKWLEENKPTTNPYKEVNKVLTELARLFSPLYPSFSDFQRIDRFLKGGEKL